MARPHEDRRPIADRIAASLRAQIMSGELEPGTKLPTNTELTKQYATSNVTIQRALNLLKQEELLEGRAGSGVYVRSLAPQIVTPASYMGPTSAGEPYRWISEAAKRSQRGSNRVLFVGEQVAPRRVAQALGIDSGATAMLRSRLGLLDDQPAELTHSYYPMELAVGTRLADRRKIPGGSPTLLTEMGYSAKEQVDIVAARFATSDEFVHLELPSEVPVIEVFRIVYSDDRRPIEVTEMVKPGHLFKMGYALR